MENKTYSSHSKTQIKRICEAASSFEVEFRDIPLKERIELLQKLKLLIEKNPERIIQSISSEVGKTQSDCEYEVFDIVDGIDQFISRAEEIRDIGKLKTKSSPIENTDIGFLRSPVGTVGLIMPWNFPFWMPMTFVVPALLAGNPVVLKPSEYSTSTAFVIQELIREAGFNKKAFQVLIGGPVVGNLLATSEEIKLLGFVGSTEVGQAIARERVNMKNNRMILEMGGNSAAIILEDADLDIAVPAVFWNSTYFAGQVCTGVKRVLVQEKIYEDVKTRLIELMREYNDPKKIVEKIGSLINREAARSVRYKIKQAVSAGNKVIVGGNEVAKKKLSKANQNSMFFEPTLIEIKDRGVDLIQDETFAPILPIIKFANLDEAVEIANETEYELSANLFSKNSESILDLANRIEVGMIFINDSELAFPGGNYWKGRGQSYLSTSSDDKLMAMFEEKLVWEKKDNKARDYWF